MTTHAVDLRGRTRCGIQLSLDDLGRHGCACPDHRHVDCPNCLLLRGRPADVELVATAALRIEFDPAVPPGEVRVAGGKIYARDNEAVQRFSQRIMEECAIVHTVPPSLLHKKTGQLIELQATEVPTRGHR